MKMPLQGQNPVWNDAGYQAAASPRDPAAAGHRTPIPQTRLASAGPDGGLTAAVPAAPKADKRTPTPQPLCVLILCRHTPYSPTSSSAKYARRAAQIWDRMLCFGHVKIVTDGPSCFYSAAIHTVGQNRGFCNFNEFECSPYCPQSYPRFRKPKVGSSILSTGTSEIKDLNQKTRTETCLPVSAV